MEKRSLDIVKWKYREPKLSCAYLKDRGTLVEVDPKFQQSLEIVHDPFKGNTESNIAVPEIQSVVGVLQVNENGRRGPQRPHNTL